MKRYIFLMALLSIAILILFSCSKDQPTEPVDLTGLTKNQLDSSEKINVLIGIAERGAVNSIAVAGGEIKHEYNHFPIVFASVPEVAVSVLEQNPNIIYVEPDITRSFSAQTLDWGVDRIDAEYVHANSSYTGAGVDVAIIDSGGDKDHPDLSWAGGYAFYGRNANDWDDKNGHGTHCAGIIAANNNSIGVVGVAPGADVWALRVGRANPYLSLILEAADWCVETHYDSDPDNDIKVISMSYGGGYSSAEDQAMQDCYDEGILLVAAAGNGYGGPVVYPAALSSVMAVSASTDTDGFASYSNMGSEIELMAPGTAIYSTWKNAGYKTVSGTSMSCPMVVGAAALAWEAHPGYSNAQIRNLLSNTAQDIGLPSDRQGSGIVDAESAALGTTNGDDYGGGGGGVDTMHVASIDLGQKKKGINYDFITYVTIHTEDHSTPVADAYVQITVHHHGGNDYYLANYTDSDGRTKVTLRGASQGMTFTSTVTGVSKDGWYYNESSNHETSDTYTIQ